MNRILLHVACLFSVLTVLTTVLAAQGPPTGTPPFGSFGTGTVDTVNLGTLNAHFTIPILHKTGRGLPFAYDLTYDTSVWYPTLYGGSQVWTAVPTYGWQGTMPQSNVAYVTYSTAYTSGYCGQMFNVPWSQYEYNNFVFHDASGSTHNFNYTTYYVNVQQGAQNCPSPGPQPTNPQLISASDSSGYTLYATPYSTGYATANVTSVSGVALYGADTTDTNGNEIINSSGVYTDTLGQNVVTVSGSGTPSSPVTIAYPSPSGATVHYTVNYASYPVQTNFGCSSILEYSNPAVNLISSVTLPDGTTSYSFAYEATPGYSGYVTGRIQQITLPTGGSIQYTYPGANDGVVCADGSANSLTRVLTPSTLNQVASTWTYSRSGSGNSWTTTVTDPQSNVTTINFAKDSSGNTGNLYETQRVVNQGSSPTLLTTLTCYNGNFSNCATASVSTPISQVDAYRILPNGSTSVSQTQYTGSGLLIDRQDFDYGVTTGSAPSTSYLVHHTAISYASLGDILDHPSSVVVSDASSNVVSKSAYAYDEYTLQPTTGTPNLVGVSGSRGNLTTVNSYSTSSAYLTRHFSYFDTGNVYQSTDVNSAVTTYVYGTAAQGNSTVSCGNSFPTMINLPVNSLSTSTAWNCIGAVVTQTTDLNGKATNTAYTDTLYWRLASVEDPALNYTNFYYTNTTTESSMKFNGNHSIAEQLVTVDGLGRVVLTQRQQGVGSGTYDSKQTNYDSIGRPYQGTMPYAGTVGQTTSTAPLTSTTYDALSRPLQTTDAATGYVSNTYTNNDVLQVRGPAPSGESTKQKQLEYDGLGRLKSVCEITNLSGSGTCGQTTTKNGYWTTYVYGFSSGFNTVTVTQSAQSAPSQTRTYAYDLLGRLVSEKNPENSTTTYAFDSASGCGTYAGDLVQKKDANGNTVCYAYDGLHRPTSVSYSGTNSTPTKNFVYDAATVNGIVMSNAKGHLAEAYTGTSGSKITDLGIVYSVRGEATEIWEATPHSGGYYHPTAAYWANGRLNTLWMSGLPSLTYGADGEGRWSAVSATSGQNPVTSVTYTNSGTSQPIGSLTNVTYGSGDNDNFSYDTNTGRMTQFKYTVSTMSEIGTLGWNANGSLGSMTITDPFNAPDAQTCAYAHDDLARIQKANCGAVWGQQYSYDAFGNINKSVLAGSTGFTWNPMYAHGSPSTNTNQYFSLPGFTPTYDANGDLLTDSFHTYTWDAEGKMLSLDTTTLTYDALGRMVEQNIAGTYYQIVYAPTGKKLAIMKAQTIQQAFVPLPGQAKAEYLSWGLSHYRHPDWLGSSRLESNTTHGIVQDTAYDPFGMPYSEKSGGNGEISFTGQNKDTAWLQYDFLDRQYDPNQGRWLSPDRAGLAAVDPASPQSWNRYAYVMNNPLALVDPFGDQCYNPTGESTSGASAEECNAAGNNWYDPKSGQWTAPSQSVTVTASAPSAPYTPPDNGYNAQLVTIALNGVQGANGSQGQSGNSQGGGSDVQLIVSSFNASIATMNKNGLRRPGKGFINGLLNDLFYWGCSYEACSGQSQILQSDLVNTKGLQAQWQFTITSNYTHTWVNATSNNPGDPPVTLDPLYGTVTINTPGTP